MKTTRVRIISSIVVLICIIAGGIYAFKARSFAREYTGFTKLGAEKNIDLSSLEFPSDRPPVIVGQEVDFDSQTSSTTLKILVSDNYEPGQKIDISQFPQEIVSQMRSAGQHVDFTVNPERTINGNDWLTYDATVTQAQALIYNHVGVTVSNPHNNELFIFDAQSPQPLTPADLTIFEKMLQSIQIAQN